MMFKMDFLFRYPVIFLYRKVNIIISNFRTDNRDIADIIDRIAEMGNNTFAVYITEFIKRIWGLVDRDLFQIIISLPEIIMMIMKNGKRD